MDPTNQENDHIFKDNKQTNKTSKEGRRVVVQFM